MKIDLFSLIVLLGALQALFFGFFLLFARTQNRFQNRMLAIFVFVLSYNGFETLQWSSGLYPDTVFFDCFAFVPIFALGPAFYGYIRSFGKQGKPRTVDRHFTVVWAALAIRAGFLVCWALYETGLPYPKWLVWLNGAFDKVAEPLSILCFAAYFVLAVLAWRDLRDRLLDVERRWLKTFLYVMGVFGALWMATAVVPYFWPEAGTQKYVPIETLAVVFIYWIGFAGFHRTRIIYAAQQQQARSYFDHLTDEEVSHCASALQRAMEGERLYLDPDISAASLAARIGVPVKTLSAVLNRRIGKGFNEYVNGWRVEAVKDRMMDPSCRHLTLTGIAYECGFNSQPTFQRAFRAAVGCSPREFQRRHAAT